MTTLEFGVLLEQHGYLVRIPDCGGDFLELWHNDQYIAFYVNNNIIYVTTSIGRQWTEFVSTNDAINHINRLTYAPRYSSFG